MKTCRLILFVTLLSVFTFSHEASSYIITSYNIPPGRPAWNGGPFLIDGSIVTYCLEVSEHLTFGVNYFGTIDDYAIKGGNLTNHGAPEPSVANRDYLNPWSEWLYAYYLSDSLTSQAKMMGLQQAIWYIEGEISSLPAGWATTYYGIVQVQNPTADIPWIHVLNLYSYDSNGKLVDNQSVIITPEPGTILLLGAGLLGLGIVVRRRKR